MLHQRINLSEGRPQSNLRSYLQDRHLDPQLGQEALRPAVIILPGGGFTGHLPEEGEPIAIAFSALGYQSFVLEYGTGLDAIMPGPVLDLALALKLVKSSSSQWSIDQGRIFVLGFGTAAWLVSLLLEGLFEDAIKKIPGNSCDSFRPSGVVLVRPMLDLHEAIGRLRGAGEVGPYMAQEMMYCLFGTGDQGLGQAEKCQPVYRAKWPATALFLGSTYPVFTPEAAKKLCCPEVLGDLETLSAIQLAISVDGWFRQIEQD